MPNFTSTPSSPLPSYLAGFQTRRSATRVHRAGKRQRRRLISTRLRATFPPSLSPLPPFVYTRGYGEIFLFPREGTKNRRARSRNIQFHFGLSLRAFLPLALLRPCSPFAKNRPTDRSTFPRLSLRFSYERTKERTNSHL